MATASQGQSASPATPNLPLNWKIEVMVRSQFSVPADNTVVLGARKPSQIPGYDTLPVTISLGNQKKMEDFLISTDSKTLARLETIDLEKAPVFSIDVSGRPTRGNPAAKVTVVNFDDLECPVCARMHQALFPGTLSRFGDRVRFIYRDNPINEIHPWATHAAVDANCLAEQSGEVYWTYVDYLHSHGQEVSGADHNLEKSFAALDRIARQEGTIAKLDSGKLDACVAKQDETQVRASIQQALSMGLEYTPAVFVNGELIKGLVPPEYIWRVIDRALRAAAVGSPASPIKPSQPAGPGN
jgi:protein-disulfide isomerase